MLWSLACPDEIACSILRPGHPPFRVKMTDSPPPALERDELLRYGRHLSLPEFGTEGQKRLKGARVVIVGAGGLGSPAALYLAAAGVGTIGLVDFDTVEASNLQRQVLYGTADIGRRKLEAARARLTDVNPFVEIVTHAAQLSADNAMSILGGYDVVLDGTDNFRTRYLVNDACVLLGKPNVYASVLRFEGQLSVFATPDGPCYRCLFPEMPPEGTVPSCAEAGVLGVVPGLLGVMQATEAIKLLAGIGTPAIGTLLLLDVLRLQFRTIRLRRDPRCPACGTRELRALSDVDDHCVVRAAAGRPQPAPRPAAPRVRPMTPAELALRLADDGLQLLDVREPWEFGLVRLPGARLAPLAALDDVLASLERQRDVVVYCHHGARSHAAAVHLAAHGFTSVWNLVGGIDRYSTDVDPALPRY